ncbi:hypothetical protein [Corallococcus sp. EGB]|uniref:hypothetical protein n=1 Tax=Corallococcus sp. EGB TaxID=1521117 RepID=UPI001CBEF65D|nr:hypothetical protein [Corallococcus sp. EGB]
MGASRSVSKWVISGLGAFALAMGVFGLLDPERQARMMGFFAVAARSPDDHTATLLVMTSLATSNTAVLCLMGAAKRGSGFSFWAVAARTLMGAGLATLALTGKGPGAFFGAAIWEWLGAAIIGGSSLWDRRGAKTKPAA